MTKYITIRYIVFGLAVLLTIFIYSYYSMNIVNISNVNKNSIKYILQWTLPNTYPFSEMKSGVETFIERRCGFTSCFVTSHRQHFQNLTAYDVIVFHGPELTRMKNKVSLPTQRDSKQKYIYVSIESSHYYPLCNVKFNNFFNWTWTYRLDSDVPYAYLTVKDSRNNVIGPSADVKWMSQAEMDPISEELRVKLKSKTKAAAWMVSNCNALSKRQDFGKELQKELKLYGLAMDVYGYCGSMTCPAGELSCQQAIERDYFFYLSFENSFSADYVTEKLLTALQNSAVPVVLGDADYSRFMPPGIYLDARALGPKRLAARMKELISNPEENYDMFRWRNHYSYHEPKHDPETDPLCKLCEMIHDEKLMSETTVYKSFRDWWNPPKLHRC